MDAFTVEEADLGTRLDQFLCERMEGLSRARIQLSIQQGKVLVNGRPGKASYRLRSGDVLQAEAAPALPLKASPEAIPLEILLENEHVVAVNKPSGMVVHAGAGIRDGTLVNALLHRYGAGLSTGSAEERPGIVHRLDRFTSGVILVARSDLAHQHLAAQFAGRTVEKTYYALVHGTMAKVHGVIESPIRRDPVHRARMQAIRAPSPPSKGLSRAGRTAVTEWRVDTAYAGYSLLKVHIHTGRTHQIRVHMASVGHPVVGDRLYGAPAQPEGMPRPERYFLHAGSIVFIHPVSNERIEVKAPLPEDFLQVLAILPVS